MRGRGGQGVIAMRTGERNGNLAVAIGVAPTDEVMLVSDQGTLLRTRVEQISLLGRNTQGVRIMNIREGEKLARLASISESAQDGRDDEGDDEVVAGDEGE